MSDQEDYKRTAGRGVEKDKSNPPKPVMNAGLMVYVIVFVLIAGLIAAGAVYFVEYVFRILGIN